MTLDNYEFKKWQIYYNKFICYKDDDSINIFS